MKLARNTKTYFENRITSDPGGFVVMEQRTRLMETLPTVKAKVAAHIQRAEREFTTKGQDQLHEAFFLSQIGTRQGCNGWVPQFKIIPNICSIPGQFLVCLN